MTHGPMPARSPAVPHCLPRGGPCPHACSVTARLSHSSTTPLSNIDINTDKLAGTLQPDTWLAARQPDTQLETNTQLVARYQICVFLCLCDNQPRQPRRSSSSDYPWFMIHYLSLNRKCVMTYDSRLMTYDLWRMILCCVTYDLWFMVDDVWLMTYMSPGPRRQNYTTDHASMPIDECHKARWRFKIVYT